MSSSVVDVAALTWVGSVPAITATPVPGRRPTGQAIRVDVAAGAAGAQLSATLTPPLDLSSAGELRFDALGGAAAEGTDARPFLVEFGFVDAGDQAGDEHRWLVPVERPGRWEPHRIGLGADRRSAVSGLVVRALTDRPTTIVIGAPVAVVDELVADVEAALTALLAARVGVSVVFDAPGATSPPPDPAVLVALTDQWADPARAWSIPLRDSFRRRGGGVVCALRPPPKPVTLEYQLTVTATDDRRRRVATAGLLAALGAPTSLAVDGLDLPVTPVPAPRRYVRDRAPLAPLVIHIDTVVEAGPRTSLPWITGATVAAGPFPPGGDSETVVVVAP